MKTLLTLLLLILSSLGLYSQVTYLGVSVGYCENLDKSTLLGLDNGRTIPNGQINKVALIGFGKGRSYGVHIGRQFNNRTGIEGRINYFVSDKTEAGALYALKGMVWTFHSKSLLFNPSLNIYTGFERINPYIKIGPAIGMHSIRGVTLGYEGADSSWFDFSINGNLSLGFNSGGGVIISTIKYLRILMEINYTGLNYLPKNLTIHRSAYNRFGPDSLPKVSYVEKKYMFADYINMPSITDETILQDRINFSNLSFVLGIYFSFPSKRNQNTFNN